jgi:hypothetical protein
MICQIKPASMAYGSGACTMVFGIVCLILFAILAYHLQK